MSLIQMTNSNLLYMLADNDDGSLPVTWHQDKGHMFAVSTSTHQIRIIWMMNLLMYDAGGMLSADEVL
ncbi:unnamed protein product [Urochloa humidicola]